MIDGKTHLAALLGHPVEHSWSPFIHNTAFQAIGMNALYVAFDVPTPRFVYAVDGLEALGTLGTNITIPHKQHALHLVDEATVGARATGAVNTIVFEHEGKRRRGDNTDIAGFLEPLRPHLGKLAGEPVVVFGAGGSARAIVYALLTALHPGRLTLVVRSPQRADDLASDLAAYDRERVLAVAYAHDASLAVREARLLVNCTPLGMWPGIEGSPWPVEGDFSAGQVVYDLVYNPEETVFLRTARRRGAFTIGGLPMLVGQAAASFALWTGREMPMAVVEQGLREHLGKQA